MDKSQLRQVIVDRLRGELENLTRAALMARDEATHEESRPENKYDTHSQEAAYLAEGQARLAAELEESIKLYQSLPLPPFAAGQPIALGALVVAAGPRGETNYFLGPRNGGIEVVCGGSTVTVITPPSPLGRLLLGRRSGDAIRSSAGSHEAALRIRSVE